MSRRKPSNGLMIKPQGFCGRTADGLMRPIRRRLSGVSDEVPPLTHWWNRSRFKRGELRAKFAFTEQLLVGFAGAPGAGPRTIGPVPISQMRRFGGWDTYVVLRPKDTSIRNWFIGWLAPDLEGYSHVVIKGEARVLLGNGNVRFFGIDKATGKQIVLEYLGMWRVGDRSSPYRQTLFL